MKAAEVRQKLKVSILVASILWDPLVNWTSFFLISLPSPRELRDHAKFPLHHTQPLDGVHSKNWPRDAKYGGWKAGYGGRSVNFGNLVRYDDSTRVSFFVRIAIPRVIMTIVPI